MQTELDEHIAGLIKGINEKIKNLDTQGKSLVQTRASLQNICKHQFEPDGRTQNNSYEKCRICGFSRKAY